MSLAEKLFGSFSDRELKKINPITKKVLALETKYQPMSGCRPAGQDPIPERTAGKRRTLMISCPKRSPSAAKRPGVCWA